MTTICLLPGDGIGPEVMTEVRKVIDWFAAEKGLAFLEAYRALQRRISAFVSLPLESLDRISLQGRLDAIALDRDPAAV